jgi:hypothetical protein
MSSTVTEGLPVLIPRSRFESSGVPFRVIMDENKFI